MPRKRDRPLRYRALRSLDLERSEVVLQPCIYGAVLRLHRLQAEMTQQELANAVDWPQSVVSKMERGDLMLTIEQLDAVVDAISEWEANGGAPDLRPSDVLAVVDQVVDRMVDEGLAVVWCTRRLWEGPARRLVAGRALMEWVVEVEEEDG